MYWDKTTALRYVLGQDYCVVLYTAFSNHAIVPHWT